jgi:HSP20 family protein
MVDPVIENRPVRAVYCFSDESQNQSYETPRRRTTARPHTWRPPTDVLETDDAVVVRVEIAGMRDGDFSITLDERTLLINGLRPALAEGRAFHQMEIPFGEFSTEVDLPFPIDELKIEAVYLDGFLRVWMPKIKPFHVQIEG